MNNYFCRRSLIHLNSLGLIVISLILLYAFFDQFAGDLPCPLCILQRGVFIAAGMGFCSNIFFRTKNQSNYAIIIISAIIGSAISMRHIFLHIIPGTGTYGQSLFGMHFYSLALLAFALLILGSAIMLIIDDYQAGIQDNEKKDIFTMAAIGLFAVVIIGNLTSTILECGSGLCPDNPTSYQLLDWINN